MTLSGSGTVCHCTCIVTLLVSSSHDKMKDRVFVGPWKLRGTDKCPITGLRTGGVRDTRDVGIESQKRIVILGELGSKEGPTSCSDQVQTQVYETKDDEGGGGTPKKRKVR